MKSLASCVSSYYRDYRRLEIMNMAASLSFYTLIAIFPTILLLATIAGSFISQDLIQDSLTKLIHETLPYQSDLLMQNMWALIEKKQTFGWFSLVVLAFSAQMLFVNFERIINHILQAKKTRHFLVTHLISFAWLLGLVFILFTPVIIEMISVRITSLNEQWHQYANFFASGGFVLLGCVLFWVIMQTLAAKKNNPKRVLWGALFFSLTLQLGKYLFKFFTLRQLDRYNLVYGSLSSIVLTTLWILYFYNIFLFFVYWTGHQQSSTRVKKVK
ncbi:MAG TPA: YihY/virulence factor BrkB family protein [bacterium]|nr:YihY/virulence factor BrkB family protein [bacterium]